MALAHDSLASKISAQKSSCNREMAGPILACKHAESSPIWGGFVFVRFKLSWYCWGRSAPKPPDTVKGLLPLYDSPLRPQGPRVQFCFVYTPLARQRLAALRVHKTKLCLRLSGKAGFELERLTKGGQSILHLKKRTQNPREAQKSVVSRQLKTKPCMIIDRDNCLGMLF